MLAAVGPNADAFAPPAATEFVFVKQILPSIFPVFSLTDSNPRTLRPRKWHTSSAGNGLTFYDAGCIWAGGLFSGGNYGGGSGWWMLRPILSFCPTNTLAIRCPRSDSPIGICSTGLMKPSRPGAGLLRRAGVPLPHLTPQPPQILNNPLLHT